MNDREAFEARMRKASTSDLTINRFGNYRSSYVQNKWNEFKAGWQAALASQAQQPTQEPVAWLAPTEDERWNVITPQHKENLSKTKSHDNYEKEYASLFTVPLYLQSQAQQEPSINDEILSEIIAKKNRSDAISDMADRMANDLIKSQAQQDGTCPECGRKKAKSADDCAAGLCPKWYAIRDKEAAKDCQTVSQAQQESKLHWCGTCEQNVERGCGDSACQYRYKLPSAPKGE